ncbi:hypothetical protein [Halostagnicola kamekurae]|uniref:Uncharacterized protein n=1 Tax=Halostagnicola kamekurae TaxID=619731 RepID=A0A1I6USQ2_9EURY|nr:hypothetical protein [Halostagnicola kamekurae]SFT04393.1 hypothetical protein SAMN04488556_4051 [Halostagnicola kamekurae]
MIFWRSSSEAAFEMAERRLHEHAVAESVTGSEAESDGILVADGGQTMCRTPGVNYEPDSRTDVEDVVADYGYDAIDAGVHPKQVAAAFRAAADELEVYAHEREQTRDGPTRSEPADFGGGESTGVQEL